jgi:hypothetical protein
MLCDEFLLVAPRSDLLAIRPPHCLYRHRHRYRYRSDTALVEAFNLRAAVHVRQKHWDAAR